MSTTLVKHRQSRGTRDIHRVGIAGSAGLKVGGEDVGQEQMHLGGIQVWSTTAGHILVDAVGPARLEWTKQYGRIARHVGISSDKASWKDARVKWMPNRLRLR